MRFFGYMLLAGGIILGDLLSKIWVVSNSSNYLINYGVSWGIGSRGIVSGGFFGLLAFCVVLLFGYSALKRWRQQKNIFPEVVLISGALANIVDRIIHVGGVIDFIELPWGISFPVFNGADVAVVAGVCLLLLREWMYETV